MSSVNVNSLPEDCLSAILCFTSPQDASRSSAVSAAFHSAADSDAVWNSFLPSDYLRIVSESLPSLQLSSKKELYHLLCDSVLVDGGRKMFKLEKSTGKKSYVLSARDLSITWSNEPLYWSWTSDPESKFSEVAMLRTMSWLEINGQISTRMLTPNTKYGAYLLIKILDRSYGLDSMASEVSVQVGGNEVCSGTAYLRCKGKENDTVSMMERLMYGHRTEVSKSTVVASGGGGEGRLPEEREDGWLEVEIGEFFSGERDEEVKMSLKEVKGYHLKGGLVVQGIEVRPKP
ncbi:F-box protein PP2-B15 [Linum grandiflorum]